MTAAHVEGGRILEPEVMASVEEALAYDQCVKKHFNIVHAGFIETVVNLSPERGRFLDVGTGTGWNAIGVAKANPEADVVGVDLSESMLEIAGRHAAAQGVAARVTFRRGDAKRLPFADGSFDSVFCHNMLHHLAEPLALVREMMRVLRSGGAFIIRDLKRQAPLVAALHVGLFSPRSELAKEEYRSSLRAALSEREWQDLWRATDLPDIRLTKQFVTHMSIEREARDRREEHVAIPVPLHMRPLKGLFVSAGVRAAPRHDLGCAASGARLRAAP